MPAIKFDTRPFEREHARSPRGRGSWAFQAEGSDEVAFSPSMTYAEARRWMTARLRDAGARGVVFVAVLP